LFANSIWNSSNVPGQAVSGSVERRADDEVTRAVHDVLDGHAAAFDGLVRRFQREATAVSYRLLNNRDDALEVVQDAFLKAYDKLSTLSEPRLFGPWLMRIVSNLSLNKRRSRALRRHASLEAYCEDDEKSELNRPDPHVDSPLQVAVGEDMRRLLAEAIDQLPERQRQALVLFSIEKMPQKEVASVLGCSVEAVKWHVFSARKKLKERLKEHL
jgi:RNA polymerase sigma-70 factor (ECF subfamily)